MVKLALIFFVVSLLSGIFGFSGVAGATGRAARILFFVALGVFVASIALALSAGGLVL